MDAGLASSHILFPGHDTTKHVARHGTTCVSMVAFRLQRRTTAAEIRSTWGLLSKKIEENRLIAKLLIMNARYTYHVLKVHNWAFKINFGYNLRYTSFNTPGVLGSFKQDIA